MHTQQDLIILDIFVNNTNFIMVSLLRNIEYLKLNGNKNLFSNIENRKLMYTREGKNLIMAIYLSLTIWEASYILPRNDDWQTTFSFPSYLEVSIAQ